MRIVSLAPSVTEILFAIGAGNEIVANTAYCDYPEDAKKIAKVGSWTYIDDEKIKKLKPDLVITSTVVQRQAHKRYKDFKHIHLDPRSLDDICSDILLLGKITNHRKEASNLIKKMKHTKYLILNHLKSDRPLVDTYSRKPKVYVEEWFDPPMAAGNWVPDIVNLSGGRYLYFPGIKKGDISRTVTDKEIKQFDPEVIFVSYCGYKNKSDPNKVLNRPGWHDINAVKNKRVYVLNDDLLNRPGPRVLQAVEEIRYILQSF